MSTLSKFLQEPTTVYNGIKVKPSKQAPHYSYFDGENIFLVREIETHKLIPLKSKLLLEKAESYEIYTVEHGFIPVVMERKKFRVSDLVLLKLSRKKKREHDEDFDEDVDEDVDEQEYSHGIFYNKDTRIVEEQRFFQDGQVEPYFGGKVVVGVKSNFHKILLSNDNSHKKLFTINNKQLKEKKELVKTSLPIAPLGESDYSKNVSRIFQNNFPLLTTFEIEERNNLIGYLHQMIGLYMADGNSREFKIFLNAKNEKELTEFLIEKMQQISGDSFGVKEQIIFRDAIRQSICFSNVKSLTEDKKQDLEDNGFFESNSNIIALRSFNNFYKVLLDLEISNSVSKVFSNIYNPTNWNLLNIYKFFEGSIQGDGCTRTNKMNVRFTQKTVNTFHEQFYYQVWFAALMLGMSVLKSKHALDFSGIGQEIFQSEGLEKKRVDSKVIRSNIKRFKVEQVTEGDYMEMYCFKVPNITFPNADGVLIQNTNQDVFGTRYFNNTNRFIIKEFDSSIDCFNENVKILKSIVGIDDNKKLDLSISKTITTSHETAFGPSETPKRKLEQNYDANKASKIVKENITYTYLKKYHYYLKNNRFECGECGKDFSSTSVCRRHIKTRHEGERFACSRCGKLFTRRTHLRDHDC